MVNSPDFNRQIPPTLQHCEQFVKKTPDPLISQPTPQLRLYCTNRRQPDSEHVGNQRALERPSSPSPADGNSAARGGGGQRGRLASNDTVRQFPFELLDASAGDAGAFDHQELKFGQSSEVL